MLTHTESVIQLDSWDPMTVRPDPRTKGTRLDFHTRWTDAFHCSSHLSAMTQTKVLCIPHFRDTNRIVLQPLFFMA